MTKKCERRFNFLWFLYNYIIHKEFIFFIFILALFFVENNIKKLFVTFFGKEHSFKLIPVILFFFISFLFVRSVPQMVTNQNFLICEKGKIIRKIGLYDKEKKKTKLDK